MTPDFDLTDARRQLAAEFPLVGGHPDVAGIFRRAHLFAMLGPALAHPYLTTGVTTVVAPEARGQVVGSLVAAELNVGLVLLRKQDRNHPGADVDVTSSPTWRGTAETFQGRSFDMTADDRVLIVDDWVTTGSSIRAVAEYVTGCGAQVVGTAVIVDKADPATVSELAIHTLVSFDDIT